MPRGASADRAGVGQGRPARRHPGTRVHRHHRAAPGIQRNNARPRLPARRHDRTVPGALADQGQLGDLGAAARRAHSGRAVEGYRRWRKRRNSWWRGRRASSG